MYVVSVCICVVTYEHVEGGGVADPAERVTMEVGEERELSGGANFTDSFNCFYSLSVLIC